MAISTVKKSAAARLSQWAFRNVGRGALSLVAELMRNVDIHRHTPQAPAVPARACVGWKR
ncbi:hypothetical protein ACFLQ0_02580 [Nitrospinota bacterium]